MFAPAAAAEDAPVSPSAYALSANGLIDIGPLAYVENTQGPVSVLSADLPTEAQSILSLKVLNAQSAEGKSWSSIAELSLGGGALPKQLNLEAELIKSTCDVDKGMSSKLVGLTVAGQSQDIAVPANTEVVPEALQDIARVTLNKQVKHDDGSMTVTAVSIQILKGEAIPAQLQEIAGETINLASATCGPAEDDDETTPPTTTPPDDGDNGGDNGNGGGGNGGADEPNADGTAPTPISQPGHIAVTG